MRGWHHGRTYNRHQPGRINDSQQGAILGYLSASAASQNMYFLDTFKKMTVARFDVSSSPIHGSKGSDTSDVPQGDEPLYRCRGPRGFRR
jgi:hypothetical protein